MGEGRTILTNVKGLACAFTCVPRYGTILLGVLSSKLDVWVQEVDVLEELMTVFCLLDDNGVIHIPEPHVGRVGAELMALTLNFSMNQSAISGLMDASQTCSKYLSWKRK